VLRRLSPPLVLKLRSAAVLHKSDIGGVRMGLADAASLVAAMTQMEERARNRGVSVDGFLVEETAPPGHEVVIGGSRDPSFGPLVMFGLGGIFVEVLRDVAFGICPITRADAVDMICELRAAPILAGARGGVAVDQARLVDALLAVGGSGGLLLECADEVAELDINPLIVSDRSVVAVDARVVLTRR
jgi:acetate---CoA ligase (ADP-forming) subunit beta